MNLKKELVRTCFDCLKQLKVKYNIPRKKYSEINNWGYYTEKKEFKDQYLCNDCLLNLYNNNKQKYWKNVTDLKKRMVMKAYIYNLRKDKGMKKI